MKRRIVLLCAIGLQVEGCFAFGPPEGYECTQNSDCDRGHVCIEGACYKMCTLQMDCGPEMFCSEDGLCMEETEPLHAPAQVSALGGDQQVTVTWQPVVGAVTYNLYWARDSGATLDSNRVNGVTAPFVHSPVVNGSTYHYALTAVDDSSESELSGEAQATPRISAVAQLSAHGGDQQVTLTWEPVAGGDKYNLYWAVNPGVTLDSTLVSEVTSPFVHAPLLNGSTYYYAMTVVDGLSESDLSAEASAAPCISAPAEVSAAGGDQQVTVAWEPVEGADTYNLYWAVNAGVELDSSRVNDVTSPFVHAALDNNTTYYFALTAVDGLSESDLSDEVSVSTAIDTATKLVAADGQAIDRFGSSIALSRDYVIVGAPREDGGENDPLTDAGAAYVFHYDGSSWDAGTKLTAPDAQDDDTFGRSVAISSDFAIVGADYEDGGAGDPLASAGAAYVYARTGSNSWHAETKLTAPDAEAGDYFGKTMALSGDYAIVGAEFKGVANSGAAYVFHYNGSSWDAGTKLTTPGPELHDEFGHSVAITGVHAIVGTTSASNEAGAAYVFARTGPNSWDAGTKLTASDAQEGDLFGSSVALDGDFAIVGAPGEDGGEDGPLPSAGAAYVFHFDGSSWDTGTKLTAPDAQPGDIFGDSVALNGDCAIVGAPWEDGREPSSNAGAAYLFHYNGSIWDKGTKLKPPDGERGGLLGQSVATSGEYAVVGTPSETVGVGDLARVAGAAYVYEF